ncbi:MAG: hypothetical protein COA78_30750 [Blastopirellula sp.]|nr:MAG: hypothetical protein COA78_30750 [Blastopirellula sp.]
MTYIHRHKLAPGDSQFPFKLRLFSAKQNNVAVQLFSDDKSHAEGGFYRNITLYDLQHSGAVHLRLLGKENPSLISHDTVRSRGGWCDIKMLNYYTQFLGLDGIIKKTGRATQSRQTPARTGS